MIWNGVDCGGEWSKNLPIALRPAETLRQKRKSRRNKAHAKHKYSIYRGRSLEQSYILMRRWKRIEKKHAEGHICNIFLCLKERER